MKLPQALEIVKEHIRIGKGMELTNGVPEALEMVLEELEVTQKALRLACDWTTNDHKGTIDTYANYFLARAKEACDAETP